MTDNCIFCNPDSDRVFIDTAHWYAMWDAYPVSPGHALIIPKLHIEHWFDAAEQLQGELTKAIDVVRSRIDSRHSPDAYNVGFNAGEAAGQTVFHLHIHVIPRYSGDVPDPRGGVRAVVPDKANYLVEDDE